MVYDVTHVRAVMDAILKYKLENVVCDPVLVSTSGTNLLDKDGMEALVAALPLFVLLTPNALEATTLNGKRVKTQSDLVIAGYALLDLGGLSEGSRFAEGGCYRPRFRPDRIASIHSPAERRGAGLHGFSLPEGASWKRCFEWLPGPGGPNHSA
jgi:Phosphomethylpyrimidine kinase